MQGTFTEKHIISFMTDLKAGKVSMGKLQTKMKFIDSGLWDGTDAPTMSDDDDYGEEEIEE